LQRLTIAPAQIHFPVLELTADQQHYLRRVLRLQIGDRFLANDGRGAAYLAELRTDTAQILETVTLENRELALPVHAAIALPKGHGFDDLVRACTELGVSHIHPVLSDHTIPSPSASRQQRWVKIAQEAAEQCERAILPQIQEISPWAAIAAQAQGQKKFCVTRQSAPHLGNSLGNQEEIWIAIGPEGGWSDRENQQALELGWEMVSLGPRILRTITAPIAALAIVGSYLDRLETRFATGETT
jgi:16S rRNA (uracil1498-N3)-methyltransferase